MRRPMIARIVGGALLLAPATVGATARADALQGQLLAQMRATPGEAFAFRQTTLVEQTGGAAKTLVEQFDPRRPAAERWSLVSVNGQPPSAKDLAGWRKIKRERVPSYGENAKWFGAPATRTDTGGVTTYRFARLPAGTLKIGSHDASADAQAEAVVNARGRVPFVERVRFVTSKPFRIMLVASVKNMVADARYTMLPGGAVVPAEIATRTAGSLMGKSGTLATRTSFDQVQPVR